MGRFFQEAGDRIGRLGSLFDPVVGPFEVQVYRFALLAGGIGTQFFDEPSVARTAAIRDYNTVNGVVFRADPLQAYLDHSKESFVLTLPKGVAQPNFYEAVNPQQKSGEIRQRDFGWQGLFFAEMDWGAAGSAVQGAENGLSMDGEGI